MVKFAFSARLAGRLPCRLCLANSSATTRFPAIFAHPLGTAAKPRYDFGMTLPYHTGKSSRRLETGLEIGTVAMLGNKIENQLGGEELL